MNPVAAKCVPICRAGCHQRSYGETGSDDVQCPRVVEYRAQREQGLAPNPVVLQISSQMGKKSFRQQKQPECGHRGTTETKKEQCQKMRNAKGMTETEEQSFVVSGIKGC